MMLGFGFGEVLRVYALRFEGSPSVKIQHGSVSLSA